MNRAEFMRQLESLLRNIPAAEREEALQYYNDYFDDAGEGREQEVIEALGNPARVAENIRRDLLEAGYADTVPEKALASDRKMIEYGKTEPADSQSGEQVISVAEMSLSGNAQVSREADIDEPVSMDVGKTEKTGLPGWLTALPVILFVFASPAMVGLLGTLFGVIVSWFALIFSSGCVSLALFVVLVVLMAVGIMCMFVDPVSGIALVGGGLICGALGILFLMLTVFMAGKVTPAMFRGIKFLFRKLRRTK